MLRSSFAGLVLAAIATTASAVPITSFTGLNIDLFASVESDSGNVVATGTTSGSAMISSEIEFSGLGFARGLGPAIVFRVEIRDNGSAELLIGPGNSVSDGAPFSYDVALTFTDPGIRITDVLDATDPFAPGVLSESFTTDTITLSIASEAGGSSNTVNGQSGEFVSFRIEAESVAVPLPAAGWRLLTGLGVMVFAARRSG